MSFPNTQEAASTHTHTHTHAQREAIFSYSISCLSDWQHNPLNHPNKRLGSHPLILSPVQLKHPVILPWWFYCHNPFQIVLFSSILTFYTTSAGIQPQAAVRSLSFRFLYYSSFSSFHKNHLFKIKSFFF